MYPYQRTPMGNPYIVGIYGLWSPRIPKEHNKYHGYTVRGTPNCPLIYPKGGYLLKHHLELSPTPTTENWRISIILRPWDGTFIFEQTYLSKFNLVKLDEGLCKKNENGVLMRVLTFFWIWGFLPSTKITNIIFSMHLYVFMYVDIYTVHPASRLFHDIKSSCRKHECHHPYDLIRNGCFQK